MKILILVGSLRRDSLNKKLAENLARYAQETDSSTEIEFADIANLPLFNQDLESSFPAVATELKSQIEKADGVIVATPEYNRAVPGVLKNAIDWSSRPAGENSWRGKSVAIVGATPGLLGTALAQTDLRRILGFLNANIMVKPELYLSSADKMFDKNGFIVGDEKRYLVEYTEAFLDFVQRGQA